MPPTSGFPVESSWFLVRRSRRLLVRMLSLSLPLLEPLSTWAFHSLYSSNGEQRRNLTDRQTQMVSRAARYWRKTDIVICITKWKKQKQEIWPDTCCVLLWYAVNHHFHCFVHLQHFLNELYMLFTCNLQCIAMLKWRFTLHGGSGKWEPCEVVA